MLTLYIPDDEETLAIKEAEISFFVSDTYSLFTEIFFFSFCF